MSRSVEVVLFDLDDTLFQHRESVVAGVLAHRRAIGGPLADTDDALEVQRWHELEEHHYHRYLRGETDFLGQRRARARAFVAPHGIDLSDDSVADAWFGGYLTEYRTAWRLHEDALPALEQLGIAIPGVRFGIITNAVLRSQTEKLEALELSGSMEHVIASAELGIAKPDPRIFHHACNLFGVDPSRVVHVGDRLETDAIGAAAAGLTGVWLKRTAEVSPSESAAVAASGVLVVGSLTELTARLAS